MPKIISVEEAVAQIPHGATIMFGGFAGCGNAHRVIEALSKSDKGEFTFIGNDVSMATGPLGQECYGVAKLLHSGQIKRIIGSHMGLNPEVAQKVAAGEVEMTLIPQGSFVEMIRAGGSGLGGVITPTGLGTIVEDGWHVHGRICIDGKEYLVEKPLHADVALLSGYKVDRSGNVWYKGTTRNFSPSMALAADIVIVEADNLVETGEIEPENVMTPGVLVDFIVKDGE